MKAVFLFALGVVMIGAIPVYIIGNLIYQVVKRSVRM